MLSESPKPATYQLWVGTLTGVLLLCCLWLAATRGTNTDAGIPTAEVQRGVFTGYLQLRGRLRATKSVTMVAPSTGAEGLWILKLIANGSSVQPGDNLIQFDATKLQQELDAARLEVKRTQSEAEQALAQERIQEELDETHLMKARYDVDMARPEAGEQEILSRIDGEERKLALADAEQRLVQTKIEIESHRKAGAADRAGRIAQQREVLGVLGQIEGDIAAMSVRAPIAGVATILPNPQLGQADAPPFKPGDQVWPGTAIIELPDLSTFQVEARAEEVDRGKLQAGLPVSLRVDAIPEREFSGEIASIGALAKVDFAAGWPFPRNFDVSIVVHESDSRFRPGMNAAVRVPVERIPDAILIPTEACFEKNGQTVAYILRNGELKQQVIQVGNRSGTELQITSGLLPGERIALSDPTEKEGRQ